MTLEQVKPIVQSVLAEMAHVKGMAPDAAPHEIVADSLEQMRFVVALEERSDRFFDDLTVLDLRFDSLDVLVTDVTLLFST
jgi:acyl carrier protein